MKFRKIFRFEFGHQVRSISTWIYLAVLLAFPVFMNVIISTGDGVYPNNTFHITSVSVIGVFIWLFMGAAIAGQAASRDVQRRMHPLTYTTPITKLDYLGARFLAAFAVNALLILSLPLGILLSFHLGLDEDALLPFRASAYLSVYFLIALPNAFVATSLQFSFAALSRQVTTSYLASLLLAIFQIIAVASAQLFGSRDLVKLLDPVGVAGIISSELGTWTPTEKNTRLITLEGMFLWNRVLWLSIAAGALFITYLRFSFAHAATKSRWSRFKSQPKAEAKTPGEIAIARPIAITVPHVQRSFRFATHLHQTLKIARASLAKISRNPVGLTLVGAMALISAGFGYQIITQFGIPLLPTTQQVLDYLAAPVANIASPWVVIPLLIMYFAGQLVWSERDARISDITDATPVSEWVLFTGKFLGLGVVIMIWMALLMTGGIVMQLLLDYSNFETGLYLKALFGLQFVEYLLFALLALVIHVVVNHKKTGYLVILLVFIFLAFPSAFKVEHRMLIFGSGPDWWYTDMRGFGPTILPWLLFKLYWIAWALILAVVARLFWARGREQNFRHRLQLVRHRFTISTFWVAIIGSGLLVTLGSFIFYNTNFQNEYLTSADINERKAEYELRYGKYRNTPQPQLTGTKLKIEIYPGQRQLEIRAAYTLVNKDSVAIDTIHLGSISGIEPTEVNFNRPALCVVNDTKLRRYIYALEHPLQQGDSLQINFVVNYQEHGFRHNGTDELVMKNGTYFTNYDVLPFVGYKTNMEITDAVTRKQYKLPARPAIPSLYDAEARKKAVTTDHNTFEAIVGTAKDEVAVAPGALLRTWTEGDRKYFHYKTDAPLRGEYAFLSGNYALLKSKWNDVMIRIYYHPGHDMNVDRMLRSVKASMEYYTGQFGPYPFGHITVVERPGDGGGASAEASMINYGEQYSIMNPDDSRNGFDLPYYILAHEVAHQWFGSAQLNPAYVEGAGVLIEGLAVYAGMQVLEKNCGDHHLQQYLKFIHSFYEMPRSLATNSLLQANESFLYYRKGGLAMYALSTYIGKEKVNGALRNLLQKHHSGELPLPTTLDLYHEIQNVTPDTLNYLLRDLFEKNTYWRLKTKQFSGEQTDGGNWLVTLKVQAQKVVVDSTGNETEVPMNDWLEVGVFEEGKELNEPLYLKMHRIQSGEQTIIITVPRKPERGGIDPNSLMIDVRLDDNIMQLDRK
ncbi:MAG TPA: M1 family aminopeptidase [Cyclobacteriaceae bacterium]|nr:M1 family aminopeptidase [Cyclobacteriaceae bacterium]